MKKESVKGSPRNFVEQFKRVQLKYVPAKTSTDIFEIQDFNLEPLKLDVRSIIPFFFPKENLLRLDTVPNDMLLEFLASAEEYSKEKRRKFGVLVIDNYVKNINEIIEDFSYAKIALLTRRDIENLFEKIEIKAVYEKLGLILTKFLGRDFLSPYVPGRPATGGRFFGREPTIKKFSSAKTNYLTYGIRRIGKTSLLYEIARRLEHQYGYRIVKIYCNKYDSVEQIIKEIYVQLGMTKQKKELDEHMQLLLASNVINDFSRYILAEIKRTGNTPIGFFIDEVDHLIEIDKKNNHQLIHIFRDLGNDNDDCVFFLAGFRRIKGAIHDDSHPFYNFGELVPLEAFREEETKDMIMIPLKRLGIEIDNDTVSTIYHQTAGLPELIQLYCAEIIQFFDENNRPPNDLELSQGIMENENFRQKVLSSFLANADTQEQILCYLVVRNTKDESIADQIEFTTKDIKKLLIENNIKTSLYDIDKTIDNLLNSAIIRNSEGSEKYHFIIPELINFIKKLDLDFEIKKLKEEIEDYTFFE